MEMTLYFKSRNRQGEKIIDLLLDEYRSKENVWSENKYQLTYNADYEFIRKLSLLFYEKSLQELLLAEKECSDEFLALTHNPDLYSKKIATLRQAKEENMEQRKNQRYFSLLPENFQKLQNAIKYFELLLKKDQEKQGKKEEKLRREAYGETYKNKKKDEQQFSMKKTATQKKKEYLEKKEKEKNVTNESNN